MSDALFIMTTSTGRSPMYSQLTSVTTAEISDGSFSTVYHSVNSLSQEYTVLTHIADLAENADIILYNDLSDLDYIKECCRQYGIRLKADRHDFLYNHISLINPDVESIKASLPVISGEFRHFYKDYKNYYYLPAEDTAYHKSVSSFVDKSARIQATASTAYTKKTGDFVPVFKGINAHPDCLFRKSYEDKAEYIPLEYLDLSDVRVLCSYIFCPHKLPDA